uniref:hypothetical protein n=1 Tax=Trichocoleus desertorum TaxID=1481672 RepID=UPI0025B51361|nr:hypothetical protein [Trichocoleus desertorum]
MSLKRAVPDIFTQIVNPAECLQQIISAYTECTQITEEERTKRREIEANEKETIAKINAQRDLLMAYLDHSFDERAENFRSLFKVVDQAVANQNNEQLGAALSTIVEIAKSCPFKNLADLASVRASLNDPNHVWEF